MTPQSRSCAPWSISSSRPTRSREPPGRHGSRPVGLHRVPTSALVQNLVEQPHCRFRHQRLRSARRDRSAAYTGRRRPRTEGYLGVELGERRDGVRSWLPTRGRELGDLERLQGSRRASTCQVGVWPTGTGRRARSNWIAVELVNRSGDVIAVVPAADRADQARAHPANVGPQVGNLTSFLPRVRVSGRR